MRDAVKRLGGDPSKVNPISPADLVIDHSVQADFSRRFDSSVSLLAWLSGFYFKPIFD